MDEPIVKKEELLSTEEEPVPEEYKENRFYNQNDLNRNNQNDYKPNIVLSSNPQTNNISFINKESTNEIIIPNTNQMKNLNITNKKIKPEQNNINGIDNKNIYINERTTINHKSSNQINTSNNNFSISRVSKAKTTIPNYNASKFDNYNIQKLRYNIFKEYSNKQIDRNIEFLDRMQIDINLRQNKEEVVNILVEKNKTKIDEDERIKAFNRLIIDANRRTEAQENLENMKNKLEEDLIAEPQKKYSEEEWKEIYNKRFKNYVENINRKKEENIKLNQMKKLIDEKEEINLCPVKKASQKHIEKEAQRMYDEAKKRKIKMDEKLSRINNYNNNKEDDASKYVKKIKTESYSFVDEDQDLNYMNSLEPGLSYNDYYIGERNSNNKIKNQVRKRKNMSVSEFNNKRFDKRPISGKSCSNINNKKNIINDKYIQKNSDDLIINNIKYKNNPFSKNDYNLEEERKNLIQMASKKNLQSNYENKNQFKYSFGKESPISGVSNIVDQFFLRKLNASDV